MYLDPDYVTKDIMLETPLTLAVKNVNKNESLSILDLLLKERVDVNGQNSNGDTALIIAIDMQNVAVFKKLIDVEKVDIEKCNLKEDTPLIIAVAHDSKEIIRTLLTRGAKIYAKNKLGHNAIHVACINGNVYSLQAILEKHSVEMSRMLRERDRQGNTPLLLAKTACCNALILVKYLISLNADVRVSNRYGNKLLHLYNKTDDVDLCEMIIVNHPELLQWVNHNKETPLHIVTKLGHKDSAKLFMEK